MAKSNIIKDLANGTIDTITALKRAKVLLAEFDNQEVQNWITYEITGYPSNAALPDYRLTQGNLIGSYFEGSLANHMVCKNVSLPLGKMPDDLRTKLLTVRFSEGVDALKKLYDSCSAGSAPLAKVVSADFFPAIAYYNDNPCMNITSASVVIAPQSISNIFSAVENKLIDILILLEKEFGILDELDLDVTAKTEDELNSIAGRILVLVYNDQSVVIGDNNKIKDSNIASTITT
jgi:hypothetical protein